MHLRLCGLLLMPYRDSRSDTLVWAASRNSVADMH